MFGGQQLGDLGARVRALHREHREIGALGELDAERRRDAAHPREILVARAGVDHDAEQGLVEEIDDEVVDDAAGLVEHAAVERLARLRELGDVVGEQLAEKNSRTRAPRASITHMCDTSKMPASRRTAWCSSICEP